MDKQTLSNYGWIVITVLVLAVMLALATPFGNYVGDAVVSVANGFVGSSNQAIDEDNIEQLQNKWDEKLNGGSGGAGTPVTPIVYQIIEGAGQTVATTDASFRSNADYNKFNSVKVDNNVVDPSNYTVSEGSTLVTFKGEYLAILSNGTHTLEVVSNDGSASCEFNVNIVFEPEVTTFTFTIDGKSYQAEEGMTWEDFVKSEYAPTNEERYFEIEEYAVNYYRLRYVASDNSGWTQIHINTNSERAEIPSDVIIANNEYVTYPSDGPYGENHSGGSIF